MKNTLRSKNLPFVATGIPTPFCNPKTKTTSSLKGFLTLVVMVLGMQMGWGQTAIYTISSKTAVTTSGTSPSGSSAAYSQTFATQSQMTSGNSTTLTLSGYAGYNITSITLSMHSNASAGAGSLSVVAGSTTITSVPTATMFNNAAWYGAWSSPYVNVVKTPTAYTVGSGQNVVFTITASTNSLFIQSYSVTYAPAATSPTVTNTTPATNITTTSATLAGNVTATGGASISANGSVYSLTATNAAPQISGTGVTQLATSSPSTSTGVFSNNSIATLSVNTQYSFNAYATNSVDTSYGTVSTFYTLANVPSAPTVSNATANSMTIALNENGNPATTQYAIQEAGGLYVQNNGTLGTFALWKTAGLWGTITASGLSANTNYTFKVKAKNGENVETAFSGTTSLSTLAGSSPVANITGPVAEESLNTYGLQLTLTNDTFSTTPTSTDFTLNNAPSGVTIGSVTYNSSSSVTLNLLYNGDFDANVTTFSVTIASTVLTSAAALTTNAITLTALTESLSVGTVTGFGNQTVNTTSAEKSFTVFGTVRSTVSLVPPTGYEISTGTGGSFVAINPINLTPTGTSLSSTTIYVRFKPTDVVSYSGNITGSATAVSTATVALTGTGIAPANPSVFSATTASNSQINLAATANGNSNNIVVVFNATGTFTSPTNGVTAGVQGDVFAGGTIWFNGAASSITNHTGLNAATTYYYKAFSYDSLNFYSAGATATATTVKAEPSVQATSLVFSTITTSTYNTAFTAAAGTPDGYLVIRSANSTLSANPVDGTAYTTSSSVGGGSVVSVGSTITGISNTSLSSGTTYYTFVFAYNNSGTTIDYLTTNPLTASTITLCAAPAPSASNVSAISFDISWTAITGAASYQLDVTTDAGFTVFVSGYNNLTVSGTSQAVSGLLSNTPYYFRVRAVNASGNSAYGTGSQATLVLTAPVATDVSSIGSTSFTANWGAVTGASSGYLLDVSTSATFGTTTNATDLFISEYIEGSSNNKYIEIYNGTGASVNLSNYKLQIYANGDITATLANDVTLSGDLANGATIVYKNSSSTIYSGTGTTNTAVNFNGDDAIALYKISTSSYVDIVGRIGTDPGTDWTSGLYTTINKTLVRKSTVTGGVTTNPATDFTTLATEWDLYNIDDVSHLGSHSFNSLTPSFVSGYDAKPISGQSTVTSSVTGLTEATTYYYRVRATDAASTSDNSNVITVVTKPSSVTWNGTAWSNSTGPDSDIEAVIDGTYTTTANDVFSAKTLTVNSGKSFTINTGHNITVAGAVTNGGTLTIANNANLVQTDVAATNTGSITVNRNSANIQLYDYTLWSSPVTNANQFLTTFSPSTLATRFYTYNFTDNLYNVVSNPAGTTFDIAKGYLIRAPNTWTAGASAAPFSGTFTGVPNNGTIPVTLNYTDAARSYNLVGNPYPSTIDAETFLTVNSSSIENALYFWRKTNGASGSAYATYTLGGATTSTPTSAAPNGTIQVGQGFFVKAKSATTLNFTNAMRLTSASTQFFRTTSEIERNRIWLNLTNTSGVFSQMLVGYMTDATLDVDSLDGKYINDSPFALTSLINSEEYTIQGKPLPFDTNDTVPLGFKTNAAGNYTIGIDHVDGLFSNGQTIYLKDNLVNTTYNLSSGDYSFASDAGTYNSRFEIVYQSALALPTFTANNVIVYSHNGEITINSGKTPMNQVRIFDVRGRLLAEKNHINATETKLTVGAQNQVLLVKIGATKGSEVTKKIIQ